jgi:cytochrome b involved in lipid metabolism
MVKSKQVHVLLRTSSSTVLKVLASETWPVRGSLGDLLSAAYSEVTQEVWDKAFNPEDLSWLVKLIPIEVPRTYSISSFSDELLPSSLDLTVSRVEHDISPTLASSTGRDGSYWGVSSGFLNPHPEEERIINEIPGFANLEDTVLVGVSRPLNFQLPISPAAPVAMFAGGSGIAPFRSFWAKRILSGAVGRNILFLGVQSRKKLVYEEELRDHVRYNNLELHTAFSRDRKGLVYDPYLRDLVDKDMEPRYLDLAIVENGNTVCDVVMSTKLGGLGGYLYICGSVSVYETVISGIRKALYSNRAVTAKSADDLLATAFAERRFMLDIFMTPKDMSFKDPVISISELSRNTGHREGSKTWIGVHGAVYDVTDFLPIHPGGSLIVAASAGLDATKTFDDLAHTSNPEVTSLLSKYFIGYMAPKPQLQSAELSSLYDGWQEYLRTCVESLTTLSFEVKSLMKDDHIWFSGGMLNMGGVRKFYQVCNPNPAF